MGAVAQAVVEPVVKAVEEVGHAVENVGREVGQAVEKVGQEVGNAAEAVGKGVETVATTIAENPATAIAIVAVAIAAPYAIPALVTAGLSTTAATIAVGAASGAFVGGMSTIDTKGSVLESAGLGAATGALGGAVAPAVSGALTPAIGQTAANIAGGAIGGATTGALTSAVTGGDIGTGALAGGVGGGVGTGAGIASGGGTIGQIVGGLAGGASGALTAGKSGSAALVSGITGAVNGALNAAAKNLAADNKPITPSNVAEQANVPQQVAASYVDELTLKLAEELGYDVSLQDVQALAKPDVQNAFDVAQTKIKIYGTPETMTDFSTPLITGESYRVKDPDTGVVSIYDQDNNVISTAVEPQQAPAPVEVSGQGTTQAPDFFYQPSAQDQAMLNLIEREQAGGGTPTYVAPSAPSAPAGATAAEGAGTGGGGEGTEGRAGAGTGEGMAPGGGGTGGGVEPGTVVPVETLPTAPVYVGGEPSIPNIVIEGGAVSDEGAVEPSKEAGTKPSAARGAVSVSAPLRGAGGVIRRPGTGSMGYYPTAGSQALAQALNVIPGVAGGGGDVDPSRTGGKKKNVWNAASLKLKDALGA